MDVKSSFLQLHILECFDMMALNTRLWIWLNSATFFHTFDNICYKFCIIHTNYWRTCILLHLLQRKERTLNKWGLQTFYTLKLLDTSVDVLHLLYIYAFIHFGLSWKELQGNQNFAVDLIMVHLVIHLIMSCTLLVMYSLSIFPLYIVLFSKLEVTKNVQMILLVATYYSLYP